MNSKQAFKQAFTNNLNKDIDSLMKNIEGAIDDGQYNCYSTFNSLKTAYKDPLDAQKIIGNILAKKGYENMKITCSRTNNCGFYIYISWNNDSEFAKKIVDELYGENQTTYCE